MLLWMFLAENEPDFEKIKKLFDKNQNPEKMMLKLRFWDFSSSNLCEDQKYWRKRNGIACVDSAVDF